jgi:hypothetical protein
MNRSSIIFAAIVTSALLGGPAAADEPSARTVQLGAGGAVSLETRNQLIVAQVPGSEGVFSVQSDGSIRHAQSGLVCPAEYPNVQFYHVFVYARDGSDVGCDYRRADDKGGAWSKLTIFATKAAPGTNLDQAFARYHNEVLQSSPGAKSQGPAIRDQSSAPSLLPEIRSEEFEPLNGATYTSQLFVAIVSGWIVEVRATFIGLPNNIQVTKEGGVEGAKLQMGDRVMGPKALVDALDKISH